MKLSDALRKAQSLGLDVVEVAPTANPPVCKIVALGKFRYDISKHDKDKKASVEMPDPKGKEGKNKVAVNIGISNGAKTEVLSGLKEGDQVVLQ